MAVTNLYRGKTFLENDNYELKGHHEYYAGKVDPTEMVPGKMIKYIPQRVNLFMEGDQPLRNIVTQEETPPEITKHLLNIHETCCEAYEEFRKDRFENLPKPLSDTITRNKLPAFKTASGSHPKLYTNRIRNQRIIELAKKRG